MSERTTSEVLSRKRRRAWARFKARLRSGNRERERAYAAGVRERERAIIPRFTCANCGGVFEVPDQPGQGCNVGGRIRKRQFVRIGGRTVCENCAAKRFRRRIDWDAPLDPAACR